MALVVCSECGKLVSDKAAACPNCGNPDIRPSDSKQENKTSDYASETQASPRKLHPNSPFRITQEITENPSAQGEMDISSSQNSFPRPNQMSQYPESAHKPVPSTPAGNGSIQSKFDQIVREEPNSTVFQRLSTPPAPNQVSQYSEAVHTQVPPPPAPMQRVVSNTVPQAATNLHVTDKVPGSWRAGRLVIGIIGIIFAAIALLDTFFVFDSLKEVTFSFLGGSLLLAASITNVAGRKSVSKGSNIGALLCEALSTALLIYAASENAGDNRSFLIGCAAIAAAFAVVNLGSTIAMSTSESSVGLRVVILLLTIITSIAAYMLINYVLPKGKSVYKKTTYVVEETFVFNNLEITIHKGIKVKSKEVQIPVEVKNVGKNANSIGMYDYIAYGSEGTEIGSSVYGIFESDSIESAGDLRPGASYNKYIYCEYDGDGTYVIVFEKGKEKITVYFKVKK